MGTFFQKSGDLADRFSSREVAWAAGITADTIKNWLSRQPAVILLSATERLRFGRGNPLRFSFVRVMQVALTARLVGIGWQPRAAAMAATAFTDVSDGPPGGDPVRLPGELFATGSTLLIAAHPEAKGGPLAQCVQAFPDTLWPDLSNFNFGMTPRPDAFVVVDVSRVEAQVRARLAEPPHE